MDLPTNIRIFLESLGGSKRHISTNDFNDEEKQVLRDSIKRAKTRNETNEFNYRNNQYITPQEYRLNPEERLKPEGGGSTRYTLQPVSYTEYQDDLRRKVGSYDKTRGKTSVSYGDYNVKSGENAAPVNQGWLSSLFQSINDPAFRMAGTLGSFNAYDTPEGTRIEDSYGFDKDTEWFYKNYADRGLMDIVKQYGGRPGSLGEILFRKYRGDSARPVDIRLGK